MGSIFISHSSQDNEIALALEHRLTQQNFHSVFLDLDPEQGIVAGQSWEQTLYRKLRACRAVLALCTDHYLPSHWCFAEIALARMEGKQIIALLVDPLSPDAELPSILTDKQFIDLRSDPEEGYERLWRGLQSMNLLGSPGEWDPQQSPYLGLSAYQEKHAPIFCGRAAEIRSGLELLGRGAPSLILVLGASGSGKSSLVRAGIVPRLRRNPDQWLVLNPFRPGQEPFRELAQALAQAYRRYAPDQAGTWGRAEVIQNQLMAERRPQTEPKIEAEPLTQQDVLARLLQQLEQLYQQRSQVLETPPEQPAVEQTLWDFLDGNLTDLRRIVTEQVPTSQPAPPLTSGPTPLLELSQHLRWTSPYPQARVLIVIDQFEELLGYEDPNAPPNRFLKLLMDSMDADPEGLMVLCTMRSDLLGGLQRHPILRGVDFESLSVGPMSVEGMRQIIETPARLGALTLEAGLADRLLADTETSDALPLLSFTLWVMWRDYRGDGKLEIQEYEALGGLYGAIAKEADALLLAAQRSNREAELQQAFLRLVKLTTDGTYARQPVDWDNTDLQSVHDLIERFVERRLLVLRADGDRRQVEVAHEALFRSWQPLKAWLDSHREQLLFKQQLAYDADQWEQQHRADEYLWRGGRLQRAQELLQQQTFSDLERSFLTTALGRQQRHRLGIIGITGTVFLALLVSLGFAIDQLRRAQAEQIRTYVAVSDVHLAFGHLAKAQIGSIQAGKAILNAPFQRVWPNPILRRQVRAQLQSTAYHIAENHRWEEHPGEILQVALNPISGHLATAYADGSVWLWHAQSGFFRLSLPQVSNRPHVVWGLSFSPDGQHLATSGTDGLVLLWEPETGRQIRQFAGHQDIVPQVVFSPNGQHLATAGKDGTARVWEVGTGKLLTQFQGHRQGVLSVAFSADGEHLYTGGASGSVHLWALKDGQRLTEFQGSSGTVELALLSPQEQRLATVGADGHARIWDLASGRLIRVLETVSEFGKPADVLAIAFSPNGQYLVTSDQEGKVRFWLTHSGESVTQLSGRQGHIGSVVFSTDGQQLATGSDDGKAIIWDTSTLEQNPQQTVQALLEINCRELQRAIQQDSDVDVRDRTLCESILTK